MHVIGVRQSLVDAHPWLPASLYKAFAQAKALCMAELAQIGHLYASLPFGVSEVAAAKALMGEDFWSYGFEANRHVLETFVRYHHEQGLSAQPVAPAALFARSTLDLSKI
jgi:4,5-dihydroxyphthalate decarboxylase